MYSVAVETQMKTILEKLEKNAKRFPNKIIFSDVNESITYEEFTQKCKSVASQLCEHKNCAIAVFDNRDISTLIGMIATLYSGNYYVVIDSASPAERIDKIFEIINPALSIIQDKNQALFSSLKNNRSKALLFENAVKFKINSQVIEERQKQLVSTDPAYVLFTSGSTGTPKGTVLSHQNILSYITWFSEEFKINPRTIFGNQTSFYFSMSVSDVYSTIYSGATLHIIPRSYFTFPAQCVEFLNERKVNTIYWVPSALCLFANVKMLDYVELKYLKLIMFAGESMPNKQLNYWRAHIPKAKFANLFGPTETTDICTFYVVNRKFKNDESLPIGVSCNNCSTFILDENNNEITEIDKAGELYVKGPFLAFGYFNNPQKTQEVFVQNPLNKNYPEFVYKTGDLVKLNKYKEYEYIGRKDFQIKHLGYRVELGEIETATYGVEKVQTAVCVYDKANDEIVLLYVGRIKENELLDQLKNSLPYYMMPTITIKTPELPHNMNGKIDRAWLKDNYKSYIKNGGDL